MRRSSLGHAEDGHHVDRVAEGAHALDHVVHAHQVGLLALTFFASLFFMRRHPAARWAVAGFALSHVLVIAIETTGVVTLRKGLASITHVLLFIIAVSLVFDVRDATMYLYYLATGHPAFGG